MGRTAAGGSTGVQTKGKAFLYNKTHIVLTWSILQQPTDSCVCTPVPICSLSLTPRQTPGSFLLLLYRGTTSPLLWNPLATATPSVPTECRSFEYLRHVGLPSADIHIDHPRISPGNIPGRYARDPSPYHIRRHTYRVPARAV